MTSAHAPLVMVTFAAWCSGVAGVCAHALTRRGKFANCVSCAHLDTPTVRCPWLDPLPPHSFALAERLRRDAICALICRHSSYCRVAQDVPEFFPPADRPDWVYDPETKLYRDPRATPRSEWIWNPHVKAHVCRETNHGEHNLGEPGIPNPAYSAQAMPTFATAAPKAKPDRRKARARA